MASTRTTPTSPRTVRSIPKGIDDNKHLFSHDLTNLEVTDLTIGGEIVLGAGTVGLTLSTTAATPAEVLRFSTLRAGADGDVQRISFRAWDSNNVLQEYAQINAQLNDVTAATLDGSIELAVMQAGTMITVFDSNVSAAGAVVSTFGVGDAVITDGSLTITDADNATTLSITNDTITSADMVDINSGSLTTGSLVHLTLDTSALITTGRALEITANAATTSTGIISVSGTALTDGWVSQLTGGGVSATASGGVLDVVAGASTLGSAIRVVSTGAATSTTVGHLLQLQDDSNALGIGVHATFDGLTTGEGVLLTHTTSVIADGGSLLRVSSSGVDTGGATNGTVLDVQASGQLAGTVALVETIVTTGTAVEINSTGAYTGTAGVLAVNGINSTTGDLVVFTGGGAGQSTAAGSVLQVNNAGATNGSDLEINHSTGVYTGTKGIFDLDANAATTGNIVNINADGLTEGTALYISATEATLTSGFYLEFFDGAANDFTVGRYGATVIAGLAAGTAALTLTAGDLVLTSGDIDSVRRLGIGAVAAAADHLTITQGTLTDIASAIAITSTWSDAADTFTGINFALTNTASAAASRLLNFSVGGSTVCNLAASGALTTTGLLTTSVAGNALSLTNSNDGASSQVAIFQGDRATPADGDAAYVSLRLSGSAGTQVEGGRITWQSTTNLEGGTADTDVIFSALANNVLTTVLTLDSSATEIVPAWAINSAAAITGTAITGTSFVIGANTLTTAEWAFLDGQDQSVFTTSSPTFVNLTITSFAANWTNAGRTVADAGILTTVDINGGSMDGVTIGAAATAAATVTTLDATTDVTVGSLVVTSNTLTATGRLTTAMTVPTVGTGFDGALVALWAPKGRVGAAGPVITEFIVDLTNLVSSATDADIIGETDAANANLGQITAAIHGTPVLIEMACLETPAGGSTDLNLYSATVATGTEDTLITDLVETLLLDRGAAWANGDVRGATVMPAVNEYLYLANGAAGTDAAYTAGKFKITIYGTV